MGWIARAFLVLAGFITSLFVARDALNFAIIQMVVGVLLFTLMVIIVACWPIIKDCLKRLLKKK